MLFLLDRSPTSGMSKRAFTVGALVIQSELSRGEPVLLVDSIRFSPIWFDIIIISSIRVFLFPFVFIFVLSLPSLNYIIIQNFSRPLLEMLLCYDLTKCSVASMRDATEERRLEMIEEPVAEDVEFEKDSNKAEGEMEVEEGRMGSMCCQRNDGRGWQCKKKAKQGQSFCNHHLSLLRSNYIVKANGNVNSRDNGNNHNISSNKAPAAVSGVVQLENGGRRRRKKAKKESASNPYEFYYYSGFGPCRNRKRGCDKEKEETKAEGEIATNTSSATPPPPPPPHESGPRSPLSPIANGEFNYDDEDDDDELHGSGESGRRRMRKPVKERSLKSLM
ncbi:uncharacterized protein [Pyrus communis]|uniref:uncharacterized protein isoform X1 n=1 Tax=Pyrus communis TaxID=23211 RepID=UPI0035C18B42